MQEGLIHKELSHDIIGAGMKILNELKLGLDEKIYENALAIEIVEMGYEIDQQLKHPVYYKEQKVGTLIPDLIVDKKVVVDPKVVTAFNENHIAKMTGYLAITRLKLALLLNFKYAKLEWKRIVRGR